MGQPLVSVLMPTYNDGAYLEQAIKSILNQSYPHLELFVVDDCSTDNTLEIAYLWGEQDTRVQVLKSDKNQGLGENLNRVKGLVQGDFVARMDGDDIAHPERFALQLSMFQEHPELDIIGTQLRKFDKENPEEGYLVWVPAEPKKVRAGLFKNPTIAHGTIMVRREVYQRSSFIYDAEFSVAEDYDLWTRLMFTTEMSNLEQALYYYRWHGTNTSLEGRASQVQQANEIRVRMMRHYCSDWSEEQLELYRQAMSDKPRELTKDELKKSLLLLESLMERVAKDNRIDSDYFKERVLLPQVSLLARFHGHYGLWLCNRIYEFMKHIGFSWTSCGYWWARLAIRSFKGKARQS